MDAINQTDMMVPAPRQVSKEVILKLNLKLDPEMYLALNIVQAEGCGEVCRKTRWTGI